MEKKKEQPYIRRMIIVIFIILFIFVGIFLFLNLGKWLVIDDQIQNSDIILVLAGSLPDRILQAIDLYNKGLAKKIVFVDSCKGNHNNSKGTESPQGFAQLNQEAAINFGIPKKDTLILEGDARSTLEEALGMKEYLKNNNEVESIILVTSKFHSRRSKIIFTKLLGHLDREICIYSSPSKYDNFKLDEWWASAGDRESVLSEYMKLVKFYFYDQFLSIDMI